MRRLTAGCVCFIVSVACLAPIAAQSADVFAWQAFLFNIAAQRTARTCERGVPDYRREFDDLYKRWFARHREQVLRGVAMFKEALTRKDQPERDRAQLEQIQKAIDELRQPPRETGPFTLSESGKQTCDEILAELKRGLEP